MFDAGTGAREMGDQLIAEGVSEADLFLSHTHIDHINGFPFFSFAFNPDNQLSVWAGHLNSELTIEGVLRSFMSDPLFPVPVDTLKGCVALKDFKAGETLAPHQGITIKTAPLNHPNGATGYRVEYAGKVICYVTDTEHVPGSPDQNILKLIDGADIVIYDAMYSDEEFIKFQGWGHSTWQECLRLCREAGVKVPVIYHHLPGRGDDALDAVAEAVDREFPGAVLAREGMTLTP
jgi:phosphoribosyl 1,2-cyclic phosphodiesterase